MEAVVRMKWTMESTEILHWTFSQKSIQKRKTNCIAGQWLYSCTTLLHSHWAVYCDDKHHQDMRPQLCKKWRLESKMCTSLRSFQTESDIKKSIWTLLYLLASGLFWIYFQKSIFLARKMRTRSTWSCTCHSLRTILATASILICLFFTNSSWSVPRSICRANCVHYYFSSKKTRDTPSD